MLEFLSEGVWQLLFFMDGNLRTEQTVVVTDRDRVDPTTEEREALHAPLPEEEW
jgi:hypothetical protein